MLTLAYFVGVPFGTLLTLLGLWVASLPIVDSQGVPWWAFLFFGAFGLFLAALGSATALYSGRELVRLYRDRNDPPVETWLDRRRG